MNYNDARAPLALCIPRRSVVASLRPSKESFSIFAAVLCLPLLRVFFTRQTLILSVVSWIQLDICIAFHKIKHAHMLKYCVVLFSFRFFLLFDLWICRCAVLYLCSCNAHRRQQMPQWKHCFSVSRIIFLLLDCLRYIPFAMKRALSAVIRCSPRWGAEICDKMYTKTWIVDITRIELTISKSGDFFYEPHTNRIQNDSSSFGRCTVMKHRHNYCNCSSAWAF